ncbi:50S ribosomal protein L24 [Candidatus Pyrohabitans sp.]
MSSRQPRKQRKALFNALLHRRQKLVSAHLSESLREEYDRRSLPVRKGDTVRILRGDFQGHEGIVERVDLKRMRIYVNGVTVQRSDGSERLYPVHPSNVEIVKLELKDEERKNILER